jgi:Hydroxymethylpyrimidine/phosphomethylpyrimidine kinase
MYAKNGAPLMEMDAIETLIKHVLPLATVITPNLPETEKISGLTVSSVEDMKQAAQKIYDLCHAAVLVKGGHKIGEATDILFDGKKFYSYTTERIDTQNTHGTGCTLSSAIASELALGNSLDEAVSKGKAYVTTAIKHSLDLGNGHGPTNHFYDVYKNGLREE